MPSTSPSANSNQSQEPIAIMTLMVRDEIDIIGDWLDYHLAQGLSRILVTDNKSVDGTYELLKKYADAGLIELDVYEKHDMQQAEVVTGMARRAYSDFGADWVLNSDADEFWVSGDGSPLINELAKLRKDGQSYPVLVRNFFGEPLESGFSFENSIYRDERSIEELEAVGLHAHPTQNLIHPGSAEVNVAHGNHFSSLPQAEDLPEGVEIEVIHFPVRSWEQFRTRVLNMGAAFERSPDLHPSPKHHTMRDYRWQKVGMLKPFFVARHPNADNKSQFVIDERMTKRQPKRNVELRGERMSDPVPLSDTAEDLAEYDRLGDKILALEEERVKELTREYERADEQQRTTLELMEHNARQHERIEALESSILGLECDVEARQQENELLNARNKTLVHQISKRDKHIKDLDEELGAYKHRAVVRAADKIGAPLHRIKKRLTGR